VRAGNIAAVLVALVLCAVTFATAATADAGEAPKVGGEAPSLLGLSLSEASSFTRVSAGHGRSFYDATIAIEVTATEAPVLLSVADGEAIAGGRRGRLVRGGSILPTPLLAAVDSRRYRSLDESVDPVLWRWEEPVSLARATIRLSQTVRAGHRPPLRAYEKLVLVTVTAGGP
jgi:hypothetical protein